MIESPLLKELFAEQRVDAKQEDLLSFLTGRFKAVPEELAREVRGVTSLRKLNELIRLSGKCKTLKEFQKRLTQGNGGS